MAPKDRHGIALGLSKLAIHSAVVICLTLSASVGHCGNTGIGVPRTLAQANTSATLMSQLTVAPTAPDGYGSAEPAATAPRVQPFGGARRSGIIRAGDIVDVYVAGEPSFSGQFPVTADGKIKLPYIGVLDAAGLDTDRFAAVIAVKAKKYLVDPAVVASIIGGTPALVHVMGEVGRQGAYSTDEAATLLSLLAVAGGVTPAGDIGQVVIVRDGKEQRVMPSAIPGTSVIPPDVPLQQGDTVIVPRMTASAVVITGAVQRPGAIPIAQAQSAGQAVIMAGGVAQGGSPQAAYVFRQGKQLSVDLRAVLSGDVGKDIALMPNDVLVVPSLPLDNIYVVGGVVGPGPQFLGWAETVTKAVTLAGGPTPAADQEHTYILRDRKRIDVNLADLLSGKQPEDIALAPNDLVVVPIKTPQQYAEEQLAKTVAIAGAVARPGLLALTQAGTVTRAVIFAGGATATANLADAYILRGDKRQPVNVEQALTGSGADPQLLPNDMLVIPEISRQPVVVAGAVLRPGPQSANFAETVGRAVAFAGGLAPGADGNNAYIMREGQRIDVDVAGIVAGAADVPLKPNDALVVPILTAAGQMAQSVMVMGAVVRPGLMPADAASTGRNAILMAGGFSPSADAASVKLLRRDQKSTVDMEAIMAGRADDFALGGGDVLIIPDRANEVIYVAGAVAQPGPQVRSWSTSVTRALALAGIMPQGDLSNAYVLRGRERIAMDANAILHGKTADIELQPNDLVVVPVQTPAEYAAAQAAESITVVGAVVRPGLYSPDQCGTVAKALAWAGGANPQADLENAYLLRDKDQRALNLVKLGSGEEGAPDTVELQASDVIVVPTLTPELAAGRQLAQSVMITGAVAQPGMFIQEQAATAQTALAMAGGIIEGADPEAAYVLRGGERHKVNLQTDVSEDMTLQAGDVLVVPAAVPEMIIVAGAVQTPGALRFKQASTVQTALVMAGGAVPAAELANAYILRDKTRIPVDISALSAGTIEDVALVAKDVLVVPMSSPDPIYVVGNVKAPGAQSISRAATAAKALVMAGGPIEELADLKNAYILRNSERVAVDLAAVVDGGDASADVALSPNDALVIPKKDEQYHVVGAVAQPGAYKLAQADTVLGAVTIAGGVSPMADLSAATVVRDGKPMLVDLKPLIEGAEYAENMTLQTGDMVVVPERKVRVFVFGQVGKPGSYPLSDDDTYLDMIAKAGGIGAGARVDRIWLVRGFQSLKTEGNAAAGKTATDEEIAQAPSSSSADFASWWSSQTGPTKGPKPAQLKPNRVHYSMIDLGRLHPDDPEARPRDGDLIFVPGPKVQKQGFLQYLLSFGLGRLLYK